MNKAAVLCYVEGSWAYFTTQNLPDQWGDDWNDRPYEHNAGRPCHFSEYDYTQGKAPWEIIKVAWEGPFDTPDEGHTNSPYSVQDINKLRVPWLQTNGWCKHQAAIMAGTPLDEFVAKVKTVGGTVYLPSKDEL